ncbi:hypothetical protein FN846DRAFT_918646 [Sphaerosporella brunnea]|uniref:P-loop containing nucleoside triphosphate hydrolase protein n=1 Tax=Sphaerosporella brunnea TaxID=1250544 RepID=A0A5J5EZ44_9PEZI|nr:hypothetical protein FN846DRAFT_918646 [Sphaerosporella brunnea]
MSFGNYINNHLASHCDLLSLRAGEEGKPNTSLTESIRTAPIFTAAAGIAVEGDETLANYTQFGLLGEQMEMIDPVSGSNTPLPATEEDGMADGRLFLNSNSPCSAFICGVQGSGKSNSLSCMLENFLLLDPQLGLLPGPLTGLVFHYDQHTIMPCEAAYLVSHVPVTVLVPPSSLAHAKQKYSEIPGAEQRLSIRALRFKEKDLNVSRMLTLMAVDRTDDKPPLYMEVVRKILRSMATSGGGFVYQKFKKILDGEDLSPGQRSPLNLRLEILESFMALKLGEIQQAKWDVSPGHLTVIDLSDPFVDEATACSLFEICLNLFLDCPVKYGRVVAVDEAHKYMSGTPSAMKFTETLLSTIRLQRHLGTRVLISTQEPTISGKLLDLCNFTLVHRFNSPEWLTFLKAHLAAAGQEDRVGLMARIVELDSGEAFLFAPSAITVPDHGTVGLESGGAESDSGCSGSKGIPNGTGQTGAGNGEAKVCKFGLRYMRVKIRKRITADGGKSVLAVE